MESCASCGREMRSVADHGGADASNARCSNCCHPDGRHLSRSEAIAATAVWLLGDECVASGFPRAVSFEEATWKAKDLVLRSPAWAKSKKRGPS